MKNKKSLYNRLVTGLKIGWNAPVFSLKVFSYHNNPLLRVFRVIAGVSILTVFSKKHLLLSLPFKCVILFFVLLHIIFISSISIIKLWYGYKVLKSDKLNVINSPVDHFATTVGKLLYCWKYGCLVGFAGLGLVGTSFLIDSMLEAGDQEKVFTLLIGKGVKLFINNRSADDVLFGINKCIKNLHDSKASYEEIEITDLFNKADKALDRKISIKKWVCLNFYDINRYLYLLELNVLFVKIYLIGNGNRLIYLPLDSEFRDFYFANLHSFKLNYIIQKKNYWLYLLNTPYNLILSFCVEQINYYYGNIISYSLNGYLIYPSCKYRYNLVSLYHEMGKILTWYCLKYMYIKYTEHFYNFKVTGLQYKKYNISILDKNFQLHISFTEFKIILTKKLFNLDTEDLIEYGYDIYIFTIFNIYLCNRYNVNSIYFTNSSKMQIYKNIQPFIGKLGSYYSSRNEVKRNTFNLNSKITTRKFSNKMPLELEENKDFSTSLAEVNYLNLVSVNNLYSVKSRNKKHKLNRFKFSYKNINTSNIRWCYTKKALDNIAWFDLNKQGFIESDDSK